MDTGLITTGLPNRGHCPPCSEANTAWQGDGPQGEEAPGCHVSAWLGNDQQVLSRPQGEEESDGEKSFSPQSVECYCIEGLQGYYACQTAFFVLFFNDFY